jgi:hypothetical protein
MNHRLLADQWGFLRKILQQEYLCLVAVIPNGSPWPPTECRVLLPGCHRSVVVEMRKRHSLHRGASVQRRPFYVRVQTPIAHEYGLRRFQTACIGRESSSARIAWNQVLEAVHAEAYAGPPPKNNDPDRSRSRLIGPSRG